MMLIAKLLHNKLFGCNEFQSLFELLLYQFRFIFILILYLISILNLCLSSVLTQDNNILEFVMVYCLYMLHSNIFQNSFDVGLNVYGIEFIMPSTTCTQLV